MNYKKINWMYILIFVTYIAVSYGVSAIAGHTGISPYVLYLVNELIFLAPAAVFLIATGTRLKDLLPRRSIKTSTSWMTVLFTLLCMPLVTVVNTLTLFFVDNTVEAGSEVLLQMPFAACFFLVAVYAPVCEELIFRGITYESLKKNLNVFQAMLLSAVFFGLAHMNFNQAAYAFVIGIILVLLREATGSLHATILFHIIFNGCNVVLMYTQTALSRGALGEATSQIVLTTREYQKLLLQILSVYLVVAAVTTAFAACVLAWIAGNEGRKENMKALWKTRRENRGRVLHVTFFIVLVLYFGMMIFNVIAY